MHFFFLWRQDEVLLQFKAKRKRYCKAEEIRGFMSCPIYSMEMVNGHTEQNLQLLSSNIYSMVNNETNFSINILS